MKLKTAYILSVFIAILAALTSIGGLLRPDLYRDNPFVKTTWLGNDAVTLFIAIPILVAALVYSARGSAKGQLIWMGMLDYMLYNYAFYIFWRSVQCILSAVCCPARALDLRLDLRVDKS